jgi:hypothetical protein
MEKAIPEAEKYVDEDEPEEEEYSGDDDVAGEVITKGDIHAREMENNYQEVLNIGTKARIDSFRLERQLRNQSGGFKYKYGCLILLIFLLILFTCASVIGTVWVIKTTT